MIKIPKYNIITRVVFKTGYFLGIEIPHSLVHREHPERSKKNGRKDYLFCENCKKYYFEVKSMKCRKV